MKLRARSGSGFARVGCFSTILLKNKGFNTSSGIRLKAKLCVDGDGLEEILADRSKANEILFFQTREKFTVSVLNDEL